MALPETNAISAGPLHYLLDPQNNALVPPTHMADPPWVRALLIPKTIVVPKLNPTCDNHPGVGTASGTPVVWRLHQ